MLETGQVLAPMPEALGGLPSVWGPPWLLVSGIGEPLAPPGLQKPPEPPSGLGLHSLDQWSPTFQTSWTTSGPWTMDWLPLV